MDGDDDDRILGLAPHDPTAASAPPETPVGFTEEAEEQGEGEDAFLDLGRSTDDDDDEEVDKENGAVVAAGWDGAGKNESEADAEGGAPLSDEALMRIDSKAEAKALGRDLYKRWKKLQKRSKKGSHHHDKKKSKNKKGDKKRKDKRSSGKRRGRAEDDDAEEEEEEEESDDKDDAKVGRSGGKPRRKRSRREKPIELGDEDLGAAPFAELDEVLQVEEAAAQRGSGRRSGGSKLTDVEARPKKMTADARRVALCAIAARVVGAMREARLQDEMDMNQRRPPLHRVGIREEVIAQCRREAMRPFLITEGILQELSTWLYDFNRRELAAYELRTAALDILLGFPIDGELDVAVARNGDEILDVFTGVTREHLIHTDLGSATNALRQDKQEVHQNRAKAVRLLERLSRAMAGGVKSVRRGGNNGAGGGSATGGGPSSGLTWKCKDDPTVAPPFHIVQTGTEVFQSTLARPDPLDPMSYLRVPPRRAPKAYVTNLGGNVGVEEN
ncbi:hypothetical protein DQ04_03681020 [Trypanosoma grayi]|uniref:hypothetical protein n=1 Tax=Trypanosoma grayi TaxID=71804 RepID=UPI0004F47E37|nr:hypothetical protein DQ04_03681020 [Trypanosoma grayi]KEG10467.1 hypothetical protein DQ04_03681020 [Trypanosoma grayi]